MDRSLLETQEGISEVVSRFTASVLSRKHRGRGEVCWGLLPDIESRVI